MAPMFFTFLFHALTFVGEGDVDIHADPFRHIICTYTTLFFWDRFDRIPRITFRDLTLLRLGYKILLFFKGGSQT